MKMIKEGNQPHHLHQLEYSNICKYLQQSSPKPSRSNEGFDGGDGRCNDADDDVMLLMMLGMEMLSTWLWLHTFKVRSRSHRASARLSNVLNEKLQILFVFI